ncbi:MAG: hypothetical protein RBR63_11015 [Methanosarcina vacuolata]|jgi:hypothetical protein|nr:hypothetical protein [Methanosarcina vacuolata]
MRSFSRNAKQIQNTDPNCGETFLLSLSALDNATSGVEATMIRKKLNLEQGLDSKAQFPKALYAFWVSDRNHCF